MNGWGGSRNSSRAKMSTLRKKVGERLVSVRNAAVACGDHHNFAYAEGVRAVLQDVRRILQFFRRDGGFRGHVGFKECLKASTQVKTQLDIHVAFNDWCVVEGVEDNNVLAKVYP